MKLLEEAKNIKDACQRKSKFGGIATFERKGNEERTCDVINNHFNFLLAKFQTKIIQKTGLGEYWPLSIKFVSGRPKIY